MLLKPVKRVENISTDDFQKLHLQTKEPVILTDFVKGSAALTKWNYDYFKKVAGHHKVNLYGREDAFNDHASSPPVQKATFSEYLDMIEARPSELRLFLFNLLKIE